MNFILHGVKFHLCVSFSRAIEVIVIFLITFVEAIPMTLPRLLGFA